MKKTLHLLLIYLLLTVTAARADNATEYYNLGLNSSLAYKRIAYFTKAIQLDPGLTQAYEGRATEYFFQRRFGKAILDYNQVIASKPSDANAFLMRGASYLKKEKGGGYKTEFKNLASHYTKRRRFETYEMLDRAIDDLGRAIQLNPILASAYSYRAEAYRLKGMREAALHDATVSIQLDGSSRSAARAYATRSKIYGTLGQNDFSEDNYQKSIKFSPYSPDFPPLNVPILFFDTYDTTHLESARWFGLLGIVVLAFVVVFKLAIPAPNKKD